MIVTRLLLCKQRVCVLVGACCLVRSCAQSRVEFRPSTSVTDSINVNLGPDTTWVLYCSADCTGGGRSTSLHHQLAAAYGAHHHEVRVGAKARARDCVAVGLLSVPVRMLPANQVSRASTPCAACSVLHACAGPHAKTYGGLSGGCDLAWPGGTADGGSFGPRGGRCSASRTSSGTPQMSGLPATPPSLWTPTSPIPERCGGSRVLHNNHISVPTVCQHNDNAHLVAHRHRTAEHASGAASFWASRRLPPRTVLTMPSHRHLPEICRLYRSCCP